MQLLLWHHLEPMGGGVKTVKALGAMRMAWSKSVVLAVAWLAPLLASGVASRAQHACDPVDDEGWRVMATVETAGVKDGPPVGAGGDWFVERVTTLLPLCNYFNAIGEYSLRSYSLDPVEKTERVAICRGGVAVMPYAGKCPPQ
jgi:hypothetical protein